MDPDSRAEARRKVVEALMQGGERRPFPEQMAPRWNKDSDPQGIHPDEHRLPVAMVMGAAPAAAAGYEDDWRRRTGDSLKKQYPQYLGTPEHNPFLQRGVRRMVGRGAMIGGVALGALGAYNAAISPGAPPDPYEPQVSPSPHAIRRRGADGLDYMVEPDGRIFRIDEE